MIGAGMATLGLARGLGDARRHLHILDKAKRPGGRCATRRIAADRHSPWFDMGAQYFTARDPAFASEVKSWAARGWVQAWQPRLARQDGLGYLDSPDTQARWVSPTGLNDLLRRVYADLELSVECQRRVTGLSRKASVWHLTMDDGDVVTSDRVLLSCPGAQARSLVPEPLQDACPAHSLLPCLAVACQIHAAPPFDALFGDRDTLAWAASNSHKAAAGDKQPQLWTLHGAAAFSARHIDDPARGARELIATLAGILRLPEQSIECLHVHLWRYAQFQPTPGQAAPGGLWSPQWQLGLAGDYLNGGRLEGAWLSGRLLADRLLAYA